MSRQIITRAFVDRQLDAVVPASTIPGARQATADDYSTRIIKLIPSESVALYLFLSGVIASARPAEADRGPLLTFVFVALLVATLLYLARVAGVTSRTQLAISTIAFAVWVFSLGGPFIYLMPKIGFTYDQLWGAILLPLFTFVAPIIDKSYTGPA